MNERLKQHSCQYCGKPLGLLDRLIMRVQHKSCTTFEDGTAATCCPMAGNKGENTSSVILESIPADKKISVIKVVREVANLSLPEAKDLVEGTPCLVKDDIPNNEAEKLKMALEDLGAVVKLK